MELEVTRSASPARLAAGLAAGATIACVDNFAFGGEVSPIVVVALLLAATAAAGFFWRWSGWSAAATAWACVPLAHVVRHAFGLPDTLHPNTWMSILSLALFLLAVAGAGVGLGVLAGKSRTR